MFDKDMLMFYFLVRGIIGVVIAIAIWELQKWGFGHLTIGWQ